MSDDYVRIEGTMKRKTRDAVLIATEDGEGWVPRTCLHADTDIRIDRMDDGDEGEFRVRRWVAENKGLI